MSLRPLIFSLLFVISSPLLALDRSQVADSADAVTPLLNGQTVPDVTLKSAQGEDVSLHALVKQKPTVILFYRGGWCPYCNAQLAGFQKVEKDITGLGYQILAISPDSPERLQEQKFDTDYQVTLLSDAGLEAIRAFGIAFYMDEETSAKYRDWKGNIFPTLLGDDRIVLPAPAAYVLDTQGVIQFQYVNPNYKVRVDPQLMYHAAKLALN
ncbi:peroxiredoxin-like family protein [Bowmanella dokdonensis]|uniref:thioredoxin-dependent peroxiredoxin n=1 Tax=Bowmanella dokdonensis TaxID=751969 RepID=A0A939IP95_9ALTE|nr:peroxiredoxin-like family protein [Bowmanella dokdonensis]MBN7825675.1 AhpC/TSA family protein [Bowmanella dokdonensis]